MLRARQAQRLYRLTPLASNAISFNFKDLFSAPNLKFSELDEPIEFIQRTQSTGIVDQTLRDKFSLLNPFKDLTYVDELIRVY